MKGGVVMASGAILSLITIFIMARYYENGNSNAVSMYFVVFLMPCIFVAIINGIYIGFLNRISRRIVKVLLALVPLIILLILSFQDNITILEMDGNFIFAAKVGVIAIGLTNLVWIAKAVSPNSIVEEV